MSSNGLFILFLILMAANVALLVFVRAATREREILVRVALGADRGRLVAQLFAEALVLGLVGAFVGLLATGISIRWAFRTFESLEGQLPFWFGPSRSLTTVAYALGLTTLGALVAGALPGLKITEGNLESRLRQSNTRLPSTAAQTAGREYRRRAEGEIREQLRRDPEDAGGAIAGRPRDDRRRMRQRRLDALHLLRLSGSRAPLNHSLPCV